MTKKIFITADDLIKGAQFKVDGTRLIFYKSDLKNRSNVAIGTDLGEYQITTPVTDGHWAPITNHETHRPIGWVLKRKMEETKVRIFLQKD